MSHSETPPANLLRDVAKLLEFRKNLPAVLQRLDDASEKAHAPVVWSALSQIANELHELEGDARRLEGKVNLAIKRFAEKRFVDLTPEEIHGRLINAGLVSRDLTPGQFTVITTAMLYHPADANGDKSEQAFGTPGLPFPAETSDLASPAYSLIDSGILVARGRYLHLSPAAAAALGDRTVVPQEAPAQATIRRRP